MPDLAPGLLIIRTGYGPSLCINLNRAKIEILESFVPGSVNGRWRLRSLTTRALVSLRYTGNG